MRYHGGGYVPRRDRRKMKKEQDPNDEHVMHLWQPFTYHVEKGHDYLRRKPAQVFAYKALYKIVGAVFTPLCYIFQGLKIEGKENLEKIEGKGCVTIMNHVNTIDCVWMSLIFKKRRVYAVSLESNFQIPLVREIIKALSAVPMSTDPNRLKEMMRAMEQALNEGEIVHMYPEGVLIPYYDGPLRKFRGGAFYLAAHTGCPVLPMAVKYRERTGLWKIIKRKPCLTLKILSPVESTSKSQKELMNECINVMQKALDE